MTRIIAVINAKGGVSKTTTTANLAYVLAQKGRKVLCIDWDSQASLTNCLNIGLRENEEYNGVYEFMMHELRPIKPEEDEFLSKCTFEELLDSCICRPTYTKRVSKMIDGKKEVVDEEVEFGFDLMPSHIMLADYELTLTQNKSGMDGFRLYKALEKLTKCRDYDYILIDCSPGMGLLNVNAIAAPACGGDVGGVLVPTNLDLMSTRGVENLIEKVAEIQELLLQMNPPIHHYGIIGVCLSLYRERRAVDSAIENNLKQFYPIVTFESKIPESVDAKKAVYAGLLYAQVSDKAKKAYVALTKEIEKQLKKMEKDGPQILHLEPNDNRKVGEANA